MIDIKKILHPTDFSACAAAAFEHALHLARHHEAALHVLHVVPTLGKDPIENAFNAAVEDNVFMKQLWAEADEQMRVLVEARQPHDVSLRRVLARGPAAGPVILEYAEAEGIDVIVMGTHGRRGLGHLLLGSVAEEVVQKAACHVLTVRQERGHAGEARPIQRILVPLDLAEQAPPLIRAARALAGRYGARLLLLHVIQPLPFAVTMMTHASVFELVPGVGEKARVRMQELLAAAPGPDVPAELRVMEGPPAQVIVEVAEAQEADLILIAPRGLTGVERFFLGSVAERVVRTASCPVFIMKAGIAAAPKTPGAHAAAYEA